MIRQATLNEVIGIVTSVSRWHFENFPDATIQEQVLKLCEEAGEVARAVSERGGDVEEEAADVIIAAVALLARYTDTFPWDAVHDKLRTLEQRSNQRTGGTDNG